MQAAKRREKHRLELKTEMLDAAREIFVRDGYEGFTMRKLAECIECSPGTIYLYFKDKREIFDCLVDESFVSLLAVLPQPSGAADEDPVELLKQGLRTYVNFGLSHSNHYRFGFLLQPADRPRRPPQRAAYDSLVGKVRLCIAAKRFKTNDVDCAAQSLWAAAHGITSLLIQRPGFPWAERNKLINQVLDSSVAGLLVQSIKSQVEGKGK
jgi:AcrR family transcriptional regulator